MSKSLVLAEKPSVAKDIARVLRCDRKINGAYEGKNYVITWALGHLVTLADPEMYDSRYKTWQLEDLPLLPKEMKLVVINQTRRQFNLVKAQLERRDIQDVIIATDAGREGELVARWILLKCHIHKPLKRLWISSVTDRAIKDGFAHLKDAKQYEALFQSALARSEADWLVGINATRALTCKYQAQLSCGRVQTPTLAIIAAREKQIKAFKPHSYYGLKVQTGKLTWQWRSAKNEAALFDHEAMKQIAEKLVGQTLKINKIEKKKKKVPAPLLYNLTELQKEANQLYGYSAKETLDYTQSLYEYHKVLTYPRTDSRYLTDDIVPTIKERIDACCDMIPDTIINELMSQPLRASKHFVNNQKVSDHHAIIPTEETAYPATFNEGERRIYHLVVQRFLAVLLPDYQYVETTLSASCQNEYFTASKQEIIQLGWKALTQNVKEEMPMADYHPNQSLPIDQWTLTEGKTQPPAYFTEATLLSAMENPTAYMEDQEKSLSKTLRETGGLGTVATRADIIDKLFNTFLIEKHGQAICLTAKGRQLLDLVPNDLRSPALTARWERELSQIADGQKNKQQFIRQIRQYTQNIITEIKKSDKRFKHDNLTHKKCPLCGTPMLEVNGKKGKLLICSNPDCRHKETLSILTNARCPNCHRKLELVGPKDKQMFTCPTCGYRQSMNAFQKEREQRKNTAGKNDVRKYMQRQQKEAQISVEDSPFAALLALKSTNNEK